MSLLIPRCAADDHPINPWLFTDSLLEIDMDGGHIALSAGAIFAIDPLDSLRRHEEIDTARAFALLERIERAGLWTQPVLIEAESGVILDGHHRFWCAGQLELGWVPTLRIAYDDEHLELLSWRTDITVTRAMVIDAGMTGRLLPKKTSRHVYAGTLPSCSVPLAVLDQRQAA